MSSRNVAVYVSCAEHQEIIRFSLDLETGGLRKQEATPIADTQAPKPPATPSGQIRASYSIPLAVSPDKRFIYAVLRAAPFRVIGFQVNSGGALTQISAAPIPEYTPFITVDRSGRFLMGNAYHGNFVWISRIENDGRIVSLPIHTVENIHNSHAALQHPRLGIAYVAVTGDDEIRKFAFDAKTGRFSPDGSRPEKAEAGTRPRHMVFHPNAKFLYCIGETLGSVDAYLADETTGALTHFQKLDAWPPGGRPGNAGTGADLHISPDGRFLYGSERAQSTISVYGVSADSGRLSHVQTVDAEKVPRSFAIDPKGRYLISAGQDSGRIGVYSIDPGGRLTYLESHEAGGGASWVEFIDLSAHA